MRIKHCTLCRTRLFFYFTLFAVLSCKMLTSCTAVSKTSKAECEVLFSMMYGEEDDEIDLAGLKDSVGRIGAFHTMQDGFFYVVSEDKLVEMNSYGSLMYVYKSPAAEAIKTAGPSRRMLKYPLLDVNGIAVDKQKRVYVACTIPEDERTSVENGQVPSWVVLRITNDESQDDYIGRQGEGGSPFPYIKNIKITADDELVVVCEGEDGVEVWYFSREGKNTGFITVPRMMNLNVEEAAGNMVVTRDVLPDRQTSALLVCADCYSGQEYLNTFIIKVDVASGEYESTVEIPPYERVVAEDFGKVSYKMPYDFLGVAASGEMYFVIATDDGFAMQIVSSDGRRITRQNLKADRKGALYHSLAVSDSGIVSAMMAKDNFAQFIWWRTAGSSS